MISSLRTEFGPIAFSARQRRRRILRGVWRRTAARNPPTNVEVNWCVLQFISKKNIC